jgi:hypothetical protein
MSFLYPAFLLGALAIAIPIVLHLLRRDVAPEVPFTAVRLLRRSPIQRSRRRRLRDLLLLAARVAALLLLAAAFARPYAPSASTPGTRVIAVDRSYSMSAPGQFDRALELARTAIDRAGAGERVAVIAFDERAELVGGPGTKADARRALEDLVPTYAATRYVPLVHKALEIAEGGPVTLVILSDRQRGGWEDEHPVSLPAGWRVESHDVGEAKGNLAVSALAVESDRLVASLRNGWGEPKAGRLRVLYDGREIAGARYDLTASSTAEVPVAVRLPVTGALAVAIDDPGGLAADDLRYRALGSGTQPRVLIVSYGSGLSGFYLSRAIETASDEEGAFTVDRITGSALSTLSGEKMAGTSLIVLTSTRGLDRRARDGIAAFTRSGGGLLITAAADLEGAVLSTIFGWQPALSPTEIRDGALTFAATDLRHPIFRPFGPLLANLGQVRFDRAWRLAPTGWNVAARFSDGTPALLEREEGSGRVVLFASDLDRRWNDFPLHPAFVPFAIEMVRYAAGQKHLARDFTVASAPAGLAPRPGVYQLGSDKRPVAVNVDVRESDTTRLSPEEFAAMLRPGADANPPVARLQAYQVEAGQSYWRYGLLTMLAALVAESAIGRVRER